MKSGGKLVVTKHSPIIHAEFIEAVQKLEVNVSIPASAARNMGENTVKEARYFLRNLDLKSFVTDCEETFRKRLDDATTDFSNQLSNKSWGAARKFLNIFLRGALYNRYLCDFYGLAILEFFLEVPLDSHVAKALRSSDNTAEGGVFLPAWETIRGLAPDDSQKYQEVASRIAKAKGVARVHLDMWYWRRDKADDSDLNEIGDEAVANPNPSHEI